MLIRAPRRFMVIAAMAFSIFAPAQSATKISSNGGAKEKLIGAWHLSVEVFTAVGMGLAAVVVDRVFQLSELLLRKRQINSRRELAIADFLIGGASSARTLKGQARLRNEFSDMNGQPARRCALARSRLRLIDHEGRHLIEKFPKNLLGLFRQCSFSKSTIHQAHPSIAGSLIYMERRMPRAETGMASLFDVSVRPPEPTDQEISEAPLSTREILRRVHGSQKVILRDLPIEGGDQARETFRANHGINFEFLHLLSSLYRAWATQLRSWRKTPSRNRNVRVDTSFWKCWEGRRYRDRAIRCYVS